MGDVVSKQKRSEIMAKVKSKDTRPELLLRSFLHRQGLRYSLHNKNYPGRPDILFKSRKIAIFVNGCFWHGHKGCKSYVMPKSNIEFWRLKIDANKLRDKNNILKIKKLGFKPITVWSCQLTPSKKNRTFNLVLKKIKNAS